MASSWSSFVKKPPTENIKPGQGRCHLTTAFLFSSSRQLRFSFLRLNIFSFFSVLLIFFPIFFLFLSTGAIPPSDSHSCLIDGVNCTPLESPRFYGSPFSGAPLIEGTCWNNCTLFLYKQKPAAPTKSKAHKGKKYGNKFINISYWFGRKLLKDSFLCCQGKALEAPPLYALFPLYASFSSDIISREIQSYFYKLNHQKKN